jgi:hypothetical protein
MNEIQIIQKQLATERAHFEEVAQACANHLGAEGRSAAGRSADTRNADGRTSEGLSAAGRGADSASAGGSSAGDNFAAACADYFAFAVTRFDAPTAQQLTAQLAGDPRPAFLQAFAQASRKHFERMDAMLTRNLPVTEWRAVSRIDADAIFTERTCYSRVKATIPP